MKSILLVLFILFVSDSFAGGKYKWPDYTPTEIPEEFQNEKAIYLMYVQTYHFGQYRESYYNNFQRIYINKKEAIDEYANRELELTATGKIVILKGRVIKKNGDIIELDDDKIIISNVSSGKKYSDDLYREAKLIYPNIQEGDVLDLVYDVDFDGYIFSETMFLAQELPVLYSRITIINNTILDLTAFPLNGLPEIKYFETSTGPTFQTEQKNVKSISDGYFNAIRPDMPKLVFNLWLHDESLTYDLVYDANYRNNFHDYHTYKRVTEQLIGDGIISREDIIESRFAAFLTVQRYLLSQLNMDEEVKVATGAKIREFYLEKKINRKIYRCLLENFLQDNAIEYEECRTSSIWEGQFDANVVALDQLSATFFIIKDDNGNDHFLFMPTKSRNYLIDEIPFAFEGNSGIAWQGEEGTLKNISKINLPQGTSKETQQTCNIQLKISMEAPYLTEGNRQDKFTGQYSAIIRSEEKSGIVEDLNIANEVQKPAKVSDIYPYEVELRQNWTDSAVLSELDGDLKMLDLSSFLPTSIFYDDENDDTYAGYIVLPFTKKQQFRFFIQSENKITLEEKSGKTEIRNTVGSCSYSLSQMGEKSIKIICELVLDKRTLETEQDNKEYMELVNFYHTMKGKKWVIGI